MYYLSLASLDQEKAEFKEQWNFFKYEETVTQQRHAGTQYECIRQAETIERATETT